MMMALEGNISLETKEMLEGVEVQLENMQASAMRYENTDNGGHFAFANVEAHKDYRLTAVHDKDYLNGVSTLDLLLIQRHILGIEYLGSPYRIIAADINRNEQVSAIDLIELRKLILGIYEELPENDSWRFVEQKQNFSDPLSPWPVRENIDIHDLSTDRMDNDFIAVKIGDVDNSAGFGKSNRYKNEGSTVEMKYDILETGQSDYLIPFYLSGDQELAGLQAGIKFRTGDVVITGIEQGKIPVGPENIYFENGTIRISWHEIEPVRVSHDEALFYVTVKANGKLNVGSLSLDQSYLANELYSGSLETYALELSGEDAISGNRLYQNVPNPFSRSTTVDFELNKATDVTIRIIDVNGRLVYSSTGYYSKGKNTITINGDELQGNGIYYLNLESEAFSATRKMIKIE